MSMFPSMMRGFEDDFFSGPMESMRRMERMMDSMMSPFGGMFGGMGFPQIEDSRQHPNNNGHTNSLMPFGFGRSLFPMDDMFGNFTQMSQDPNCHSFSSSTVMTYTTDETGRPQVYQASSSTRTAPGGVKETRETVQDSRSGLQKMAIGHHLNERAHVIEKKKFRYTGEEEENHEYVNLDDDEAETFDQEWQQRASHGFSSSRPVHHPAVGYGSRWRERSPDEVLAITDGSEQVEQRATEARPAADHQSSSGGRKKLGFMKKKGKSPNRKPGHKKYHE